MRHISFFSFGFEVFWISAKDYANSKIPLHNASPEFDIVVVAQSNDHPKMAQHIRYCSITGVNVFCVCKHIFMYSIKAKDARVHQKVVI